jgi:hypothetical protein
MELEAVVDYKAASHIRWWAGLTFSYTQRFIQSIRQQPSPQISLPLLHNIMRLSSLLSSFTIAALAKSHIDLATYLAIEKTLNDFSFAIDARPVLPFDDIFTHDAYTALQHSKVPAIGIQAINEALVPTLPAFKTQCNFGTKSIVLNSLNSARAITDFIGTFWGTGNKSYDYLIWFQQYHYSLTCTDGVWKITNKTLITMVSYLSQTWTVMQTKFLCRLQHWKI